MKLEYGIEIVLLNSKFAGNKVLKLYVAKTNKLKASQKQFLNC